MSPSPVEQAVLDDAGLAVFDQVWQSGGVHRHHVQIKRVDFPHSADASYYIQVSEPGACDCVRRVDLGVLVHALLNAEDDEVKRIEDREQCGQCGHRHHVDDAAVAR